MYLLPHAVNYGRFVFLAPSYDRYLYWLSVCNVGVLCQTVGWIRMPLGTEIGLDPGHVSDEDPAPLPHGKGHSSPPPLFGPCLLWPNGRPSQLLLSSYFLFVYEMYREPLNGFAPNSHERRVYSLTRISLMVKVKDQRSRSPGTKKRHFRPFRRPACGLCLVKHA